VSSLHYSLNIFLSLSMGLVCSICLRPKNELVKEWVRSYGKKLNVKSVDLTLIPFPSPSSVRLAARK